MSGKLLSIDDYALRKCLEAVQDIKVILDEIEKIPEPQRLEALREFEAETERITQLFKDLRNE